MSFLILLIILIIVHLSSLFEISSASLLFMFFIVELVIFERDMLLFFHIIYVSTLGIMHLRTSHLFEVLIT
jgi:hypothetical protein